ncbi:phosphotransferase [Halovenus salina]|uniref:Phosphotransferase n=1 Tax=Halovenus salina TaxID=1510225 RepID=A0ABD5VZE2_9EURY
MDTTRIERALGTTVRSLSELDGGMIGTVHRVALEDGRTVVAKTGETPLSVEARMLQYLDASGLPVPAVLAASDNLLVLTHVPGDSEITPAVERDAADHLAALHETTADRFGFPFATLTGTVTQPNPGPTTGRASTSTTGSSTSASCVSMLAHSIRRSTGGWRPF